MNSTIPVILAIMGAFAGSGGILFGAVRYNRDEAGKVIVQQTSILTDMRALNDELIESLDRVRTERDAVRLDRDQLRNQLTECKEETRALRWQVKKLDTQIKDLKVSITDLKDRLGGIS